MLHHLLEKYIPSEYYASYLKEIGHSFTDFEAACILNQIGFPEEERLAVFRELLTGTRDEELARQIREEIDWRERELSMIRTGGNGVVFMTLAQDEENTLLGTAANFDTAVKLGLRTGQGFTVKKHRLLAELPEKKQMVVGYWNPYLSGTKDLTQCAVVEDENFGRSVGSASYQADGRLTHFYSLELEQTVDARTKVEHDYSPKRFTNAYIPYPNPYERGDVVFFAARRGQLRELPGIVETSREEWRKYQERIRSGLNVDQSDASLTVEWLHEDGKIWHSHNAPVFLEKLESEKDKPWHDLVQAASALLKGNGSLDWFLHCYEGYQEAVRKNDGERGSVDER